MADSTPLDQVIEKLTAIQRIVDVKDKSFDAMYSELQGYKDDWQYQREKPFLLDLLLFYDTLVWFQSAAERSGDEADTVQFLIDEFLELLYRRDVTPIEPQPVFDPKIHRAISTEATRDTSLDRHIAKTLKRGFQRGSHVLRPEEVVLYRANGG